MEYLTFIKLSSGGYKLSISVDARLLQVQLKPDSDAMQLVRVGASSLTIGLHQLDEPVFSRFEWVIHDRFARSSAPHYVTSDEDQTMDMEAVNFLVRYSITNIISLNTQPLSKRELLLLSCHEITYTHIAVADYHSPTPDEFDAINSSFKNSDTTLVYSGYGHGRTGTAVSALQLYSGRRLCHADFKANFVATEAQFDALKDLKEKLER
jgi:hypothetical protein